MSQYSSVAACFDGLPQTVDRIDEPVDRGEVFRYAGYPHGHMPKASMHPIFDRWIEEAARRARPRGVHLVLPVVEGVAACWQSTLDVGRKSNACGVPDQADQTSMPAEKGYRKGRTRGGGPDFINIVNRGIKYFYSIRLYGSASGIVSRQAIAHRSWVIACYQR